MTVGLTFNDLEGIGLSPRSPDSRPPPVGGRPALLPFSECSPDEFEALVANIASRADGYIEVRRFGESGDSDQGVDVVATADGVKFHGYQCKRYEKFGPRHLAAAVEAFVADPPLRITHLIIAVSAEVRSRQVIQRLDELRRAHPQFQFELRDGRHLSDQLRNLPDVVEVFFGDGWREAFCLSPFHQKPAHLPAEVAQLNLRGNDLAAGPDGVLHIAANEENATATTTPVRPRRAGASSDDPGTPGGEATVARLMDALVLADFISVLGDEVVSADTPDKMRSLARNLWDWAGCRMRSEFASPPSFLVSGVRRASIVAGLTAALLPRWLDQKYSARNGYRQATNFYTTPSLCLAMDEINGFELFREELIEKLVKLVRDRAIAASLFSRKAGIESAVSSLMTEAAAEAKTAGVRNRLGLHWCGLKSGEHFEDYDIFRDDFRFRTAAPDRVIGLVAYMRGSERSLFLTPPQELRIELIETDAWILTFLPQAIGELSALNEDGDVET